MTTGILFTNIVPTSLITQDFPYNSTTVIFTEEVQASKYGFVTTLIFATIAGLMSLVTITGNLVVILSFILERSIRQPSNYFIASLAVSDLLIGAVSMPFYTAYLLAGHYWLLGEILCDLWLSIDYSACLCSIYTVFCITVDRYCSVKIPAKYRAWRTNKKILIIIAVIWTIPVFVFFTSIFGWQHFVGKRTLKKGECTVQYLQNAVFNSLLQIGYFWVTLTIMCSLYAGIYAVALGLQKKSEEKRQKIAKLVATSMTKPQKVYFQRSEEGNTLNADEMRQNRTAIYCEKQATFANQSHLSTSYFRITSSSSMALSSLTESELSPHLEESNLSSYNVFTPDIQVKLETITSQKLDETPEIVDAVLSNVSKDADEDKFFILGANVQSTISEETSVQQSCDHVSFAKSRTTETTLSGILCSAQSDTSQASCHTTSRPDIKKNVHQTSSRGEGNNKKSTGANRPVRQYSINTEEGSDEEDSRNDVNSRSSSVASNQQKTADQSDEVFKICSFDDSRMGLSPDQLLSPSSAAPSGSSTEQPFSSKQTISRYCCFCFKANNRVINSSCAVSRSNNKISSSGNKNTADRTVKPQPKKQQSRREDRAFKALRTITIILGAFVICWTPWHVLSLIMGFCSACVDSRLYDISYWLCYINSPMNPFCYAFANQQFKKTFVRIFRFDWQRT